VESERAMEIVGLGKRVQIFIGEADLFHGALLYSAILEKLPRTARPEPRSSVAWPALVRIARFIPLPRSRIRWPSRW
jgi:hypothetical protein